MTHNVKTPNKLFKSSFIYRGILLSLQIEETLIKLYNSLKRHNLVRCDIDTKTLRKYIKIVELIISAIITAIIIKHGIMLMIAISVLYLLYCRLEKQL